MAETARLAVFHGTGRPFEIREYPVPDPEPGAMLIKIALANVCGSDMHYWRGEQDYAKMGRPLPLNTGHEHVGTVAKLGEGVTADSMGQPLKIGDRVLYRYFCPCGRCKACLRRQFKSCPTRQANWLVSCEVWPHFQGGFGQYFYLRPNHAVFKLTPEITDEMAAGINCAYTQVYAGLEIAQLRAGQTVVVQGAGGLGVYACAVAREMGAARVVVIDGLDERLELAKQFGATDVVDLRQHSTPAERIAAVKKLTDDWGGDVVLELVGHPGVVDEGLRMTAPRGHVPRDRQHQRGLEGRVRSVLDHLRQPPDHRPRALRGRAPARRPRSHAAHADQVPLGPRGLPQVPARADQRGLRAAGQGPRHPRGDRPELKRCAPGDHAVSGMMRSAKCCMRPSVCSSVSAWRFTIIWRTPTSA